MHPEAFDYVLKWARPDHWPEVLDIGGRNINGSPRNFISHDKYLVVDLEDGPGVDIVGDFTLMYYRDMFDLVLCLEVLEHVRFWVDIVHAAIDAAKPGGRVIFTTACEPRAPHSGHDGGPLGEHEYYGNIRPPELLEALSKVEILHASTLPRGDLRAVVQK